MRIAAPPCLRRGPSPWDGVEGFGITCSSVYRGAAARRRRAAASSLCLGRAASLRAPTKCCAAVRERNCGVVNFPSRSPAGAGQHSAECVLRRALCGSIPAGAAAVVPLPAQKAGAVPLGRRGRIEKRRGRRLCGLCRCAASSRSPRQVRFVLGVRFRCAPTKRWATARERKCGVFNFPSRSPCGSGKASGRMRFAQGALRQHPGRRSGSCSAARPKGGGRPRGTAWKDSEPRIPASIVCAVPPRSPRQVRLVLGVRLRCVRRQSAVPQCEKEIAVFSIFLPAPSGGGPAFGRMRFAQGALRQHPGRRSGSCSAARPKGGGRPPGTAWKD